MIVLSIDPGPEKSAAIEWNGEQILFAEILPNNDILEMFKGSARLICFADVLVIEEIVSYGMPVGKDVFNTVFWSGRFAQASLAPFHLMPRREVKIHLCGSMKAKDGNIRQAMIDRFGPVPTKKLSPPAYGGHKISKDLWSAWALSVTFYDLEGAK
jgi:hypothetical protein